MSATGTAILAIVATLLGTGFAGLIGALQAGRNRWWQIADRDNAQADAERQRYQDSLERRELATHTERVEAYQALLRSADVLYENAHFTQLAVAQGDTDPETQKLFGTRNEARRRFSDLISVFREAQVRCLVLGDAPVVRAISPLVTAIYEVWDLVILEDTDDDALKEAVEKVNDPRGDLIVAMRLELARFLNPGRAESGSPSPTAALLT